MPCCRADEHLRSPERIEMRRISIVRLFRASGVFDAKIAVLCAICLVIATFSAAAKKGHGVPPYRAM